MNKYFKYFLHHRNETLSNYSKCARCRPVDCSRLIAYHKHDC